MNRLVLDLYRTVPSQVVAYHSPNTLPLLENPLGASHSVEIRRLDLELSKQALDYGCDPNAPAGNWPSLSWERYPFTETKDERVLPWCPRTIWEAWLDEAYIQVQRRSRKLKKLTNSSSPVKALVLQRQEISAMMALLLRYGADLYCMPCATDHHENINRRKKCIRFPLIKILERITPAESQRNLHNLLTQCCNRATVHGLRLETRRGEP